MLDDSKRPVCFTKKNVTMSPVKMQHITSNIISLHDKNLNRAVEIGITFIHIFEANYQADCNIYLGWKTVKTWYWNGVQGRIQDLKKEGAQVARGRVFGHI